MNKTMSDFLTADKRYFIVQNQDQDYWSNTLGWVEYIDDATVFSEYESCVLSLPIGGYWVKVGGDDED